MVSHEELGSLFDRVLRLDGSPSANGGTAA
jgi:hypothetical protein